MSNEVTPVTRRAWLIVLLLMPVALLNYLDRQMLASMQASVMESIPSLGQAPNREELWGFMLGQFKWVYAVFSIIGGFVADRFSRRFTICVSLFVWSTITALTGMAETYQQLLWARSLMGISEAFYIPTALALIADYHPGRTSSRAVGLHQMAIYMGVILGGFGGYVAAHESLGWRLAFYACGVIGMLYALPLLLFLRDSTVTVTRERWNTPSTSVVDELLRNPAFWLLVIYFTLPAMAGWVIRDWMPAILRKDFSLGQGPAGVAATLSWQLAAIIGVIIGGAWADRMMRQSSRGRIYVSAIGMSMMVPAIFGVGQSSSLWFVVSCLIFFGIGWGFFDCNNMPILSQIVSSRFRATGYGIMNFVSISCGGLADWGFGILRDREVPLPYIFGGFASLSVLSVIIVLLIRPRQIAGDSTPPRP